MQTTSHDEAKRPLHRSGDDRLIAGVASGIAAYFDVDVVVVRVVLVVLALVGGIGVPLYLAAWLLVPEEGRDESIAEQLLGARREPAFPFSSERTCGTDPGRDNVTAS
jgi:phage shock protein PspC (stress-responsive transcriptional regulator)